MSELKLEQQAVNYETMKHIQEVQHLIYCCIEKLLVRCREHDQSKLSSPEVEIFTEYTVKLKNTTYGSDEYKKYLEAMKPALDNHYKANRHHPEHWSEGINDMSLIDMLEMFCDWCAASQRHADGDIRKSIEINTSRFGISEQLKRILLNTVEDMCFDKD